MKMRQNKSMAAISAQEMAKIQAAAAAAEAQARAATEAAAAEATAAAKVAGAGAGVEAAPARDDVSAMEVDHAARGFIEKSGYGKKFGHGLGHGFGLQIHETPFMSSISEAILKPGMVLTVEPGIYLPNWGGVRIEDDILVTKDGHEVLTSVPKTFEESRVSLA